MAIIKEYNIVSTNPNFGEKRWVDNHGLSPVPHENWFSVQIPRSGLTRANHGPGVPYINSSHREKIIYWCMENCNEQWSEETILTYVFEDEEDSVLFALTWC